MNKASGGDGIPVELFQILKDDAVKVLHSIYQHIWKTQQWPQDWKKVSFHSNHKERQCQRMLKNTGTEPSGIPLKSSLQLFEEKRRRAPETDDAHTARLLVGIPDVLVGGCAECPRVQAVQLKGPRRGGGRGFTFDGGLVISYLFP